MIIRHLLHTSIFVLLMVPITATAQIKKYTFEEVDSLLALQPKKVVVFIHTDWCRFCHQMTNTTFKNKKVISKLNDQFYFVELNGEERRDILFNGHTFVFKPTGPNTGAHELAQELGTVDNKVSFPTVCILNENYEIIYQYGAYLSDADLLKILEAL